MGLEFPIYRTEINNPSAFTEAMVMLPHEN